MITIYALLDPAELGGRIRYIGKTIDPDQRMRQHQVDTPRQFTHAGYWIKKLQRAGLTFRMIEVDTFDDGDDSWRASEQYWISTLRTMGFKLTNLDGGGFGGEAGRSKETIAKVSAATSAINRQRWKDPDYRARMIAKRKETAGKFSEEHRAKLSAWQVGKKHSPETRAKIAASVAAHKKTPEHCAALGEANRRRKERGQNAC